MRDTIYRDEAIEAVAEDLASVLNVSKDETRELAEHALSALPSTEAVEAIRDTEWVAVRRDEYEDFIPSAEAVQGWIPCSERLPEIDETLSLCDQISDEVLGTDTYGNIRHVYLTNCGYLKPTFCTVEEGMSVDIVAWMALPEPYEEVER